MRLRQVVHVKKGSVPERLLHYRLEDWCTLEERQTLADPRASADEHDRADVGGFRRYLDAIAQFKREHGLPQYSDLRHLGMRGALGSRAADGERCS